MVFLLMNSLIAVFLLSLITRQLGIDGYNLAKSPTFDKLYRIFYSISVINIKCAELLKMAESIIIK